MIGVLATALVPLGVEEGREEFAVGDRGFAVVDAVRAAEGAGFRGVVLGARDGEVVALVASGRGADAVSAGTVFEIASVTKQFTAAAVMKLVEDGRLGLDDPIAEHLPGVPEESRGITVRHLLQHTSGIPGSNSRGSGEDLAVVLPVFLAGGPRHEPGTHWEYWNQGYALVSEVIARASGEAYADYLRRALFEPAGMESTVFTGDDAPEGVRVAYGASRMGPGRSALEHPYGAYGFQYRGMGGVVSNAWDLWRWDRALAGEEVLSEASKEVLFEPGLNGYALGWFVSEGPHGVVQRHGGGVRGFSAELRRYPDQDGLVVVLCAFDGYRASELADAVEAALFGEPGAGGELSAELRPLVGRYAGTRGVELVVTPGASADDLKAVIKWGRRYPDTRAVMSISGDTIIMDDGHSKSTVTPEIVEGVAQRLSIAVTPAVTMELERSGD